LAVPNVLTIYSTWNRILKVDGQLLKITSANLAYQNKACKQSVNNFQKLGHDIKDSFAQFEKRFESLENKVDNISEKIDRILEKAK